MQPTTRRSQGSGGWVRWALAFCVYFAIAGQLVAQDVPFDGVALEAIDARCGPGKTYVTVKIKKGAVLRVVQRVQGWLKIVPPEGSYSFISKAFVDAEGKNGAVGVVNRTRSPAKAPNLDVKGNSYRTQVKLVKGARVQIMGQFGGFYHVQPPEGAFVYVPASKVRRASMEEQRQLRLTGSMPPEPIPLQPVSGEASSESGTGMPPLPSTVEPPSLASPPEKPEPATATIEAKPPPVQPVSPAQPLIDSAPASQVLPVKAQPQLPVKPAIRPPPTPVPSVAAPPLPQPPVPRPPAVKPPPAPAPVAPPPRVVRPPLPQPPAGLTPAAKPPAAPPAPRSTPSVVPPPMGVLRVTQPPVPVKPRVVNPVPAATATPALQPPPARKTWPVRPLIKPKPAQPLKPAAAEASLLQPPHVEPQRVAPVLGAKPPQAPPWVDPSHPKVLLPRPSLRELVPAAPTPAPAPPRLAPATPPLPAEVPAGTRPPQPTTTDAVSELASPPADVNGQFWLAQTEQDLQEASLLPLELQPIDMLLERYRQLARDDSLNRNQQKLVARRVVLLRRRELLADALGYLVSADRPHAKPVAASTLLDPRRDPTGRLLASGLYNGSHLPRLYRLVDPVTSRTKIYVRPTDAIDPRAFLGKIVVLSGQLTWDTALRKQVWEPTGVALLRSR